MEKPKVSSNYNEELYQAKFAIDGKSDTFFSTKGPYEDPVALNTNEDPVAFWHGSF